MVEKSVAIKTAKDFVDLCIAKGLPVRQAILFGSYAKGEQRENSDIDIALVSDIFTLNFIENNHKTALLNYEFPDVEVHHFSSLGFNKETPFINEIKKTGITIFEQNIPGALAMGVKY